MNSRKERYILGKKPLGSGGQAEVFEARDREKNVLVALKRLTSRDKLSVARMKREIEVQRTVNHYNVMPILDYSRSYLWYTMPLADQVLGKLTPPIDTNTICRIVEECAQGLAAAHTLGYIHRDLTPNNVLRLRIGEDTSWVVSDWGLVRRHGMTTVVRTLPGNQFGTYGFAAPELWEDAHTATERADVYSLGRVVAWCVTGRAPMHNVDLIPEGVWTDFVYWTTLPDKENRAQNMDEVLDLLQAVKSRTDNTYSSNLDDKQSETTIVLSAEQTPFSENTTRLIHPLSPVAAKFIIRDRAQQTIQILKEMDLERLSQVIHPEKGLRFSPYPFVNGKDRRFRAKQIAGLDNDTTEYLWGYADGSGYPIYCTFAEYYKTFVYSADFVNADNVRYNEPMENSNTANNILEYYESAISVEYSFIGFEPQFAGMDWQSLQLVFEQYKDSWYLVGIVHGQWTI